jgi:hypothetical protein
MDTLVIVRKIREAEALADSGKHGEARRLLEPLLFDNGLTETHRKLVTKKLDLFKKQHERMTRIISRRGTATNVRDTANESSERTAIRQPLDDAEKSERPTDLAIEKDMRGEPTEVVPRARSADTEVPERRHKLKIEPQSAAQAARNNQSSATWRAVDGHREVKRPQAASDSQELAPVSDTDEMDALEDATAEDPRKTDMFVSPPRSGVADTSTEESAPTIGRYNVDRPVFPVGNETPAPGWRDTPVPQPTPHIKSPDVSRSGRPAASRPAGQPGAKSDRLVKSDLDSATVRDMPSPALTVRDSIVMSDSDTVVSPRLPEKPDDDSTYLMAEEYFTSRATARNRERSNPELKALADRLPDDDLRRELALEVVKLRQQLESAEKEKRENTRTTGRKIVREDKPESGSFHIPASQVNTIVRRAAGTDDIEVHMPGRDEEAQDLKVLRRDSVRGKKAPDTPADRIALAQDYIDAAQINRPSLFRPIATWLGVAVILAIIGWAVYWAWQTINAAESKSPSDNATQ